MSPAKVPQDFAVSVCMSRIHEHGLPRFAYEGSPAESPANVSQNFAVVGPKIPKTAAKSRTRSALHTHTTPPLIGSTSPINSARALLMSRNRCRRIARKSTSSA